MIKPLKEYDEAKAYFVVCDIENLPDGTVIDIDTCWRNDDGDLEHYLCQNWTTWFEWIRKKALKDRRFRQVYAHNGGGWDWLSLIEHLTMDGLDDADSIVGIVAGSSLITARIKVSKKFTICLSDSLKLLQSGLDKLSKKFLGYGKQDLGGKLPHEVKEENPHLYYAYLRDDTENLIKILEISLDTLRENVAKIDNFGPTIASTALKVFKTVGIETPIDIPKEDKLKDFLREGYTGGRVEVFSPGYFKEVNCYDINSLYPHAMATTFVPISSRGYWTNHFDPSLCGCYTVHFKQQNKDIPAVLSIRGKSTYQSTGTYFTPEIAKLLEVDPNAKIEVENGYVFQDTEIVFKDYVEKLYAMRLTDPDGPLSLICKILMNSLYGKFGQQTERTKLLAIRDFVELTDLVESGKSVTIYDIDRGMVGLSEETSCNFEHVGIAGMITSRARAILYDGLLNQSGTLIYCDTDSVHTTGVLPSSIIGSELGKYKKEFEGEGVYAGKKLYGLRDKEGEEKIRAKGVSVGGRNGCSLSFDKIRDISQGAKIRCTYSKPATLRQVFAGKTACKFEEKSRTIQSTVNR